MDHPRDGAYPPRRRSRSPSPHRRGGGGGRGGYGPPPRGDFYDRREYDSRREPRREYDRREYDRREYGSSREPYGGEYDRGEYNHSGGVRNRAEGRAGEERPSLARERSSYGPHTPLTPRGGTPHAPQNSQYTPFRTEAEKEAARQQRTRIGEYAEYNALAVKNAVAGLQLLLAEQESEGAAERSRLVMSGGE